MSTLALHALRREARKHLELDATVIDTEGPTIQPGETFTARFTITNTFKDGDDEGDAYFNDIVLHLTGTQCARVEGGNRRVTINEHLGNGHTASLDVTFEALQAFPVMRTGSILPEINLKEPYVEAELEATFDLERYLRIRKRATLLTQIEE